MANNFSSDSSKFICEKCDYNTCRKSQFERHNLTKKHLKLCNLVEIVQKVQEHKCANCNRVYKHQSSLCKHVMVCKEPKAPPSDITYNILELVKQNQEFKQLIIEQNQKLTELASKPTTINNNVGNKTKFNLQFFLNDTCKDALNLTDFVNSLKLKLTDLSVDDGIK